MKKISLLKQIFLIGILTFSLLPIRVFADTMPSNEPVSYSFYIDMVDHQSKSIPTQNSTLNGYEYLYDLCVNLNLRSEYIGYITVLITYSYNSYVYDSSTQKYSYQRPSKTVSHSVFVNGNTAEWRDNFSAYDTQFYANVGISSLSITSSNVVEMSENTSLQDILSVLNDIYDSEIVIQGLESDISDILNNIYQARQYNVPVESLPWVTACFGYGLSLQTFSNFYYYSLPVFKINKNQTIYLRQIYGLQTGTDVDLYFYSTAVITATSQIPNYFTITGIDSYELISQQFYLSASSYGNIRYYHLRLHENANNVGTCVVKWANNNPDTFFIPVYIQTSGYEDRFSTDFALLFGFSNQLLDDLHIIANGTNQSQSSSSAADQENASFSDQASDLYDQENDFITDFQDSLSDVSPDFNMSQGFGSMFLTSASWVRDQFDNIVDSTPFASLLTFSLTLGIGLLIIGKVIHK